MDPAFPRVPLDFGPWGRVDGLPNPQDPGTSVGRDQETRRTETSVTREKEGWVERRVSAKDGEGCSGPSTGVMPAGREEDRDLTGPVEKAG